MKSSLHLDNLRADEKTQPETLLLDRAYMLNLTAPQMTVLLGGLRSLGANVAGSRYGVLTDKPGVLTQDFFPNLLAPGTRWKASESDEHGYEIRDSATDELKWTATAVDLAFGSNSQLRAIAESTPARTPRQVRRGLRRGLDHGHGTRPVRPPLTPLTRLYGR